MLHINNHSEPLEARGNRPFYKWTVFVDEPDSILEQIAEVEYTLHPTFPEPKQIRKDKQDKFALSTSGWGEFTILIDVRFRDGDVETVPYWLDFSKRLPDSD